MSNNNKIIFLSIAVILVYLSPWFILGQDCPVTDWDGLDSNVIWYKTLASSGQLLANNNSEIPNYLKGLPRSTYPSELRLFSWLYYFFEPLTAYVLNEIIMRIVAFWGMYLLIRSYFNKSGFRLIDAGVALTFALQPFWHFGGLSVAGIPLALYALLNIRNRDLSIRNWFILVTIPFHSSLILSMFFFLLCVGILWLYDVIKKRQLNLPFLGAIVVMTFVYCLVEYRLFASFFTSNSFVSHRVEFMFERYSGKDFVTFFVDAVKQFFYGYLHAPGVYTPVVVLSVFGALYFSKSKKEQCSFLTFWLIIIAAFSTFSSLWQWNGLIPLKEQFDFLRMFNLGRFSMLNPAIWYVLFACSLSIFFNRFKMGRFIVIVLLIAQIGYSFYSNYAFAGLLYKEQQYTTFRSFYSERLFDKIKRHLNSDISKFRVLSIGIEPAISQYNGFYTLDGYFPNYPLRYKHEFRKIIEKELQKDDFIRNYFDYFGSRCYAFVDELDRNTHVGKNSNIKLTNLELNINQFKSMGGKYIFSAIEIGDPLKKGLYLSGIFTDSESLYKIYLYEAI